MTADPVARLRDVIAFLLGEAPLDGRWYGDEPPRGEGHIAGYGAPYWWRKPLREAAALLSEHGGGGEADQRELIRRLYVELLWCDRQLVSRGCKQGGSVRDVLADALSFLKATPPTPSAPVVDDAGVLRELIDRYRGQIDNHGEYHGDLFTRAEAALSGVSAPVGVEAGPLAGKYGDLLRPFVAKMNRELHANAAKGERGWLQMDRKTVLLEIFYHVSKLMTAARDDDQDGIREYGADVANMAMMLVDVCDALPKAAFTPPAAAPRVECNCHLYGKAEHCPLHTQADYDSDTAASEDGLPGAWEVRRLRSCERAWLAVCGLLNELVPDWCNTDLVGREAALATIRRLAASGQPGSAVQGEAVWMFKSDGAWHTFVSEKHRIDTIADGRWDVRQFFTTTPPPAPAAEQLTPGGTVDPLEAAIATHSDDELPGMWERGDFTGCQPEARGVEGLRSKVIRIAADLVKLTQPEGAKVRWIDELVPREQVVMLALELRDAAYSAAPNPVRAEQPEGKGEAVAGYIDRLGERIRRGMTDVRTFGPHASHGKYMDDLAAEAIAYAANLAAAHAAEVAERDARIALLQKECQTRAEDYATLTAMWAKDEAEYRARAEAAERDARRLQEVLNRVPTGELNEWLGCEMERYERAPTLDEFRAAIDAAIATTEQAARNEQENCNVR